MPDIFFLVEEQSDGASEAWVGVPASASLQAGAGALSKADRTNIFIDTDKHIDTRKKKSVIFNRVGSVVVVMSVILKRSVGHVTSVI